MDDTLSRILAHAQQLKVQGGGLMDSNNQPAAATVPLPTGVQRATLSPEQQETLFQAWVSEINSRPSHTYTPEDRAALQFAVNRTLRELGH